MVSSANLFIFAFIPIFIASLFEIISPWILNWIFYHLTQLEHLEKKIDYSMLVEIVGSVIAVFALAFSAFFLYFNMFTPILAPSLASDYNIKRNLYMCSAYND